MRKHTDTLYILNATRFYEWRISDYAIFCNPFWERRNHFTYPSRSIL